MKELEEYSEERLVFEEEEEEDFLATFLGDFDPENLERLFLVGLSDFFCGIYGGFILVMGFSSEEEEP